MGIGMNPFRGGGGGGVVLDGILQKNVYIIALLSSLTLHTGNV